MNINDEPYISEEQQKDFDLLKKLSTGMTNDIHKRRIYAIESLTNDELMISKKQDILETFIHDRIFFDDQRIAIEEIEYKYSDLYSLAENLFHDKSFFGNDCCYVINALTFYENSITFEDVIIAYHNFRLQHEDKYLWWLSLLLCKYIYTVLSIDGKYKEISFECHDTQNELKNLAAYVINFWNRYLKDETLQGAPLVDDKKIDFYNRMDYDAGHYFAIQDASNDEEVKQIDAEHATFLISQCSKSLYLLLSTIKELDSSDFSSEVKMLRHVVTEICDNIYIENEDAYRELEEDIRLNSYKMELFEKTNEIKLLKFTLQNALVKLRGQNSETTLSNRKEALQTIALVSNTEELIEEFSQEFSKLLMDSICVDLDTYYERIETEIGTKYKLLPETALNALVSAEYLYDMFVKKKAPVGFDYSGIAVLYFQAFETTYNKLLVEPYSDWLSNKEINELFEEKEKLGRKKKRNASENARLDKLKKEILKQYFSTPFDMDLFFSKKRLIKCLEIGKFQRFIDLSDDISNTTNSTAISLINYLENDCFKKKLNSVSIKQFAKSVRNATDPRNKAAH